MLAHYLLDNPPPVCVSAGVEPCYSTVYFFGAPVIYWQIGSMAFLLRGQAGMDVLPGEMPPQVFSPARFIFTGGRFRELDAVRYAYPGGVTAEVKSADGRVLALVYDWPLGDFDAVLGRRDH